MRLATYEIHGFYPFRHVDLDVIAFVRYGEDYLDVTELYAFSSRRGCMVKASPRLALKFQEANWVRLEQACEDHIRAQAEICRELRDSVRECVDVKEGCAA